MTPTRRPGVTGEQREVDLDGGDTRRPVIVAVGVEVREAGDGLAVRRVEGLVLWLISETGAVVGPHHGAVQIAQTQA
jgi:hypothetical protein